VAGSPRAGERKPKSRWSPWEWLVYTATLVSIAILAGTAFGAVLSVGALGGWALFAHMVGAGMFVFVLPVLAVTWCEPCRFDLRRYGERGETGRGGFPGCPS
jgi:membrane protein implicated in regulation of membrane protease activity